MNDGPVLVTGASGFVGGHLLEQLRDTRTTSSAGRDRR